MFLKAAIAYTFQFYYQIWYWLSEESIRFKTMKKLKYMELFFKRAINNLLRGCLKDVWSTTDGSINLLISSSIKILIVLFWFWYNFIFGFFILKVRQSRAETSLLLLSLFCPLISSKDNSSYATWDSLKF